MKNSWLLVPLITLSSYTLSPEYLIDLARTLNEVNLCDTALTHINKYIASDASHTIDAYMQRGCIYFKMKRFLDAINDFDTVIAHNPNSIRAQHCKAYALMQSEQLDKAISIYQELIDQHPNDAHLRLGLSLALLSKGDFERGWHEHEWRWEAFHAKRPEYNNPVWDGSADLNNKTILITCEQGSGDTFQFIRYAKLIKEMGAHVIVQTSLILKTILEQCPYIDHVICSTDTLPAFDFHASTMSLPFLFKTCLDTVPTHIPYLYANPELVTYWCKKLAADTNFKIGLCWQGNPNYSIQELRDIVKAKSCHVHTFLPLADIKGISLYSLQKIGGEDQLEHINEKLHITAFSDDFDNSRGRFMDTAAVITNLDLVITIDTSIAHLAAGLGKPTWVLLPKPSDWRWMLKRTDTPWYPNMRLFRQSTPGDWDAVIQNIVHALQQEFLENIS
ncbi:MAG TPA: tetratricopeptide repeat protein [Candidatus Dependentiae bacterium]|nr:tetratricopeptide repeat protein [Candidatus Dependentiae bacterium]HRQ62269.1 tetratricopeptide repeat protein [Candidatus Dependentiae bacterium]